MSMRFEPKLTAQETPALTLAAAVGVARAVSEVCGLEVGLKWPNDLFIGGRKVGGILTEGRTSDDGRVVVVVGVGLNLNVEAGDFPDELASVATSLSAEAGRGFDRLSVVTAVADALSDVVELATQPQGLRPILEEWQARSVMDGRRVKTSPGGVEGVARGLSAEGGLLVETAAGEVEIKSGEVLWG